MKKLLMLVCAFFLAACGASHRGAYNDLIGAGLPKTHPDALVQRTIILLHPESG